jgi:urease accessory protein
LKIIERRKAMARTLRIGIGGPIGCGKTELIEKLAPRFIKLGFKVGLVTNDIYSKEDARRLSINLKGELDPTLIVGIETGMCPHTAVRDDPSMNLSAVQKMEKEHPDLDIIMIESGGDNVTLSFSPRLADFFIYMIDVAGGDKTIRKGGLGIKKADLLVVNKIDLAPYLDTTIPESSIKTTNLGLMRDDAQKMRPDKPTIFVSLRDDVGVDEIVEYVRKKALFK